MTLPTFVCKICVCWCFGANLFMNFSFDSLIYSLAARFFPCFFVSVLKCILISRYFFLSFFFQNMFPPFFFFHFFTLHIAITLSLSRALHLLSFILHCFVWVLRMFYFRWLLVLLLHIKLLFTVVIIWLLLLFCFFFVLSIF